MTPPRIPVCEPSLGGNELAYVTDAVRSGWISSGGEYLKRFEDGFAAYVGVGHGIGTTSGTTALHLALAALGVGPGDEVIIPDFTMIASAFAVCAASSRRILAHAAADASAPITPRRQPRSTSSWRTRPAMHPVPVR